MAKWSINPVLTQAVRGKSNVARTSFSVFEQPLEQILIQSLMKNCHSPFKECLNYQQLACRQIWDRRIQECHKSDM